MLLHSVPRILIDKPCHADWQQMPPTDKGKHCSSCNKEVIDFSKMSDQAMIYFLQQQQFNCCGRFNENQLRKPLFENVFTKQHPVFKTIALCIALCFLVKLSPAQNRIINDSLIPTTIAKETNYTISGVIVDEKWQTLKGAVVKALNTNVTSTTDEKGRYEIKLAAGDIKDYTNLSFSYEGKQMEVRSFHRSVFPMVLNMEMEPVNICCIKEIMGEARSYCSSIDISFPADQLFEKQVSKKKRRSK